MNDRKNGAAFAAHLAASGLESTDRSKDTERNAAALREIAGREKMKRNNDAIAKASAEARKNPDQIDMFG